MRDLVAESMRWQQRELRESLVAALELIIGARARLRTERTERVSRNDARGTEVLSEILRELDRPVRTLSEMTGVNSGERGGES